MLAEGKPVPSGNIIYRIPAERVFVEAEQVLAARARSAGSALSSPTGVGRAREDALSEELRRHLPGRISVVRGEIVDQYRGRSGEVDAILADTNKAVTRVGGDLLVPVEAAVAAIEVKSTLIGAELESTVRKAARIKKLRRTTPGGMFIRKQPPRIPLPPESTSVVIFGYDGPKLSTIIRRLLANPDWYDRDLMMYGPDLIVIPGQGSVAKNDLHIILPPPGASDADADLRQDSTIPGLQLIVWSASELLNRYGSLVYPTYPITS